MTLVVFTLEKVEIILGVTAIIIVLAYFFRFGRFSRRKTPPPGSGGSQSPKEN